MKGNKTKISDKTASVAKQKSENLHQSQLIKPILKQKERTENDRYARKERDRNNMSSILPRGVSHNKNSKKVP
jgi:phage-related minor tail protein